MQPTRTDDQLLDLTIKMLSSSSAKLDDFLRANHLSPGDMERMADYANAMAQRAAILGEYLEQRSGHAGHELALAEGLKMRTKVRKAIGYTIP